MIAALARALSQLLLPPLRRVVALSLGIAVLTFALLWFGVAVVLGHASFFAWRPLDWLADLLGAVAVLLLTWLLFPTALTAIMSCFVDRVAGAVEAVDYPGRGPPRHQPLTEMAATTLRLMGAALVLNLLALPVYLLAPGINVFLFLALNGYLLGREYFEAVALRRLDVAAAKAMRDQFRWRVFLGGVVIAGLFALPLVNLIAPVIATVFMLHIFEGLPRAGLQIIRR
ncbi:MAG TPA: EI24 domain-containing protein [Stellaceae bacterium]|nr:EI24 domain-containing protein [Stellaceae bacterium]